MRRLICFLLRHRFVVHKHITGDHDTQTWRALLRCRRCQGLFVMSEPHQAFLRYDNDPQLRADLLRIYPQLSVHDLDYAAPRLVP